MGVPAFPRLLRLLTLDDRAGVSVSCQDPPARTPLGGSCPLPVLLLVLFRVALGRQADVTEGGGRDRGVTGWKRERVILRFPVFF